MPYTCFFVVLIYSTTFIYPLYCHQDDGTLIPSARFHICGDFNIYHKEWLGHSNKIDEEGRYCKDFTVAHELKSLQNPPVFLMQQAIIQTSLSSSSYPALKMLCISLKLHVLQSVSKFMPNQTFPDLGFHRTIFLLQGKLGQLQIVHVEVPFSSFFKHSSSS